MPFIFLRIPLFVLCEAAPVSRYPRITLISTIMSCVVSASIIQVASLKRIKRNYSRGDKHENSI